MAKKKAFIFAAILLAASSCKTAPKELSVQKKIFTNSATSQNLIKAKPCIKGNDIAVGNKKLQILPNSQMQLFANGQLIASIYYNFKIASKDGKFYWVKAGSAPETSSKHAKYLFNSSKTVKNGNSFEYEGKLKLTGGAIWYKSLVTLEENGLIKISCSWGSEGKPEEKFESAHAYVSLPGDLTAGTYIVMNGKKCQVPKNHKWGFANSPKAKNYNLTLFPQNPQFKFKLSSDETKSLAACQTKWNNTIIKICDKKGEKQLSFYLDITEAPEFAEKVKLNAGINFDAIEKLELPDYEASKNLMQNPSFEGGLIYLYNGKCSGKSFGPERWAANPYSIDGKVSKFGNSSFRIKTIYKAFSNSRGLENGNVTTWGVPLQPGEYTLSFYAKGEEGKKQKLQVWVPNNSWFGNPHTILKGGRLLAKLTKDWKRYSFTFKAPMSMLAQLRMSAVSSTGEGYVWIDGMQLEKGNKATKFEPRPAQGELLTSSPDNFIDKGKKIDARLKITAAPNASGKVKVDVKNFFDENLFSKTYDFKCDKNGIAIVKLPFDGKFPQGIFVAKASYELSSGKKCYDYFRFSIMPFLDNNYRLKKVFSASYGSSEFRYDFYRILDRWNKMGIGSTGHMKFWQKEVWNAYSKYSIEPYDCFMYSRLSSYNQEKKRWDLFGFGIRKDTSHEFKTDKNDPRLLVRDFNFDADGVPTKEYLEKLKKAAAEVARQHPWIRRWCLGGEMFSKWPFEWWSKDGTEEKAMEHFAKILIAFKEGVKQGNPNAIVFQGDPSNMRPNKGIIETAHLLDVCNKLSNSKFDLIGIHPYRDKPESPDLDANTEEFFKMLEEKGYGKTPVFYPEMMHWGPYTIPQWNVISARWTPPSVWIHGPLSYDMGWTERISAAWYARSWIICLKYSDRIHHVTAGMQVNNFDMDLYLTPFAAQKMPNTIGQLLGDSYFKKDARFAPYVRCYIFEDAQKRPIAAVWCHHPKLDAGLMESPVASAEFKGDLPEVFDLMGVKRTLKKDADGKVDFPISSFPIFFRGKKGSLDSFINSFEGASLISGAGISPLVISAKPANPKELDVGFTNFLSREFKGTICAANGKPRKLLVPGAGQAKMIYLLPEPLNDSKIVAEYLPLEIKNAKSAFRYEVAFDAFVSKKINTPVKIDGNLSDWDSIKPIKLKRRVAKKAGKIKDSDFSGWFKTAWNEKGIYICANITDDKFTHQEYEKTGSRWKNDCLQIYFDTACDARSKQQRGYDSNDYDYAVFPNADAKSSIVFRYVTPEPQLGLATRAPKDKTIAEDIPSAFKKTPNGYVYEVFFPAKYLLPIRLENNFSLGFGLYAADRDEGKKVESALTIDTAGKGCYNNPHLWPVMLLNN